jgi:mRNA interferase RelE/StbE
MGYSVQFSNKALKTLKKIDRNQARIILSWIEKNLENCDNPRSQGKALGYGLKGYWRYRVGVYRLIALIEDDILRIEIINVGHRNNIYK